MYEEPKAPDEFEDTIGDYRVNVNFDWNENGYWQAFINVYDGRMRHGRCIASASFDWWDNSGSFSSYDDDIPDDDHEEINKYLESIAEVVRDLQEEEVVTDGS